MLTVPTEEVKERFLNVLNGDFDSAGFDCGRTALYMHGFIDKPYDDIPPWGKIMERLQPIDSPKPWCLAIYTEQVFNHTGIILSTEPNIVFSKHGVGGIPKYEPEEDIMEDYPDAQYFRVDPIKE